MWASGVLWKEHATFAMATLRKFGFGTHSLQGQIMEEVDCLMGELQKKDKQSINIKSTLDASVSNVICSILFGRRFDYEDAKFKELVISLEKMFASTNPSSPVFIFSTLHHLPMSSFGQMEKSFKEIDEFTKEMIQEHRRKFDENNINDFIDSFLMEKKRRGTEGNSTFTGSYFILLQIQSVFLLKKKKHSKPTKEKNLTNSKIKIIIIITRRDLVANNELVFRLFSRFSI